MLSNVRLIVLVTKDNRGGQRYRAPFEIAVLFTNAQKSQSYNYQEACKPAAKIMIKTVRGEQAKGLLAELLYQITRLEVTQHQEHTK